MSLFQGDKANTFQTSDIKFAEDPYDFKILFFFLLTQNPRNNRRTADERSY